MCPSTRALALLLATLPLCAAGTARAQDSDGDPDVLSRFARSGEFAWYENRLNEASADFGILSLRVVPELRRFALLALGLGALLALRRWVGHSESCGG